MYIGDNYSGGNLHRWRLKFQSKLVGSYMRQRKNNDLVDLKRSGGTQWIDNGRVREWIWGENERERERVFTFLLRLGTKQHCFVYIIIIYFLKELNNIILF